MISKEEFMSDERFKVLQADADRMFSRPVKKYEICTIKLSYIKKNIGKKVIDLKDTASYKFINGEMSKEEYEDYCRRKTEVYEGHSYGSFKYLIDYFTKYDMKKNAIVIDQFGFIRDGQHRASILLKRYGSDYRIPVVKIYYSGLRLGARAKLFIKGVRDLCKN